MDGGQHHQWVEAFHHHLRTSVGEAVHRGEHHTEAVEERHAHAELVFACELHVFTGEETVVGNIIMSKHHALRETGSTRGVLHVHHVVASHFFLGFDEFFVLDVASEEKDFCGVVHPAILFLSDVDDVLHLWETFAFQIAALASLQFGEHGIDHVHEIVTATVSVYDTEGVHVRVLAKVFQLGLFIVGVHGYRHSTNFGTGVEEGEPVGHVSCPDAHVRTSFHTDGEQAFRHVVHPFIELTPCEAQVAVGVDDVFFVGGGFCPMLQPIPEGSIG